MEKGVELRIFDITGLSILLRWQDYRLAIG
jgi:hypothetical protein